jgi:hypothetical protein
MDNISSSPAVRSIIASIIPGWLLPLAILISWVALTVVSNGGRLLTSFNVHQDAQWCNAVDKAATGWSRLSDEECMSRFNDTRTTALKGTNIAGGGRGFIFFKHIHKAGGTSLCQLAQANMMTEGEHVVVSSCTCTVLITACNHVCHW